MQLIVVPGSNGEVILAEPNPHGFEYVLVPRLIFRDWAAFVDFYHPMRLFYDENCPKVPDVFEEAFKEVGDGKEKMD